MDKRAGLPRSECDDATEAFPETQITESSDDLPAAVPRSIALTVLAHPDPSRVGEKVLLPELGSGRTVELGRGTPAFVGKTQRLARPLDDNHLSRTPIRLRGFVGGSVVIAREKSPMPVKIDGERLSENLPVSRESLERGTCLLLGRRVVLLLHLDTFGFEQRRDLGMIGESFETRRLREQVRIAARLDVPVLIRGASGTGKELVARAIHEAGGRSTGPFVAVNMAAITPSLAAAELFGAAKGSYTGADRRKAGFFERAATGTLFLDEIGETPDTVQPLLLRALESGEIQSVGGAAPRQHDVRLIAATDADLEDKMASGQFRTPLLHRLAGFEIRVPPVRARRGDFGRLLFAFLEQELERMETPWPDGQQERPWPPAGLVAKLAALDWPGNIRQLRNVARQLAISHATGTELPLHDLLSGGPVSAEPKHDTAEESSPAADTNGRPSFDDEPPSRLRRAYRKPSEVSSDEVLTALRAHDFQLKASAEALGLSRASLYLMVDAMPQIRKASELAEDEIQSAMAVCENDWLLAARSLEVSVYALKRRAKALGLEIESAAKI